MTEIRIDAWTFSGLDARRTIEVLHEVVEHAGHERPAQWFADHTRRAREVQDRWAQGEVVDTVLGDAWELITSIRSVLAANAALPMSTTGRVEGVFASAGGVPKRPLPAARVTTSGLVGDRQAVRRHHGRPWQALCLWSREVVDGLSRLGHPIAPGYAGENISVAGIDWSDVRPGVRLRLGDMTCEVSAYAIPCRKNSQWFRDGSSAHIHHGRGPLSRVYATVVEPGDISPGDSVILEP